jgi:tetratricopeptide (TPR) repeat protein/tRNA A-37 threonylcarbamoyl transferase component Bud32
MGVVSSATIIGRRYQLQDRLGVGNMGVVYRASDLLTGQSVALKRVRVVPEPARPGLDTEGLNLRLALAHEFQLLASLRHPHIIHVLDYGFDEDRQPYFTMELLEHAQTLLEAGAGQPLHVQADLLTQTLQALAYLHRRGVLHRDLKPANLLVIPGANGTRHSVKVMDFGLSVLRGQQPEDEAAGTPSYMAPEVLRGFPASEASDLYAIGVMAYELLVGHYPYEGSGMGSIVQAILSAQPGFPSTLDRRMAGVLARLMAKQPDQRYQSAEDVIAALAQASGRPVVTETAATRESFLQAAAFVGREDEVALLRGNLDAAIAGYGSTWLVGGESGVGKSRLLNELRTLAMVKGALVLRGQAIGDGGSPYEMWRQPIQWLSLLSDLNTRTASVLKPVVPNIEQFTDAEVGEAAAIDPRSAQTRLFTTVSDLLRQRSLPTLIILEDLHWADTESLALLAWLNRVAAQMPLMIVGSFRDDEAPDLPIRLPDMSVLRLNRLTHEAIGQLSEHMLGAAGAAPEVVDFLEKETEGNVFFLVEVVRSLAEEAGQLDRVADITLPSHIMAGGVRRIVARRIAQVPTVHQPLLRLAAVFGRVLDLELLRAAEPVVSWDEWLSVVSSAAVLDVSDGHWQFSHDKLREYLLDALGESERRELHRRAALAIEHVYPGRSDYTAALVFHAHAAGDTRREAYYASLAGQQALESGAYQQALEFLERAFTLESQPGGRARQDAGKLRLLLGETLYGLGNYDRARDVLRESVLLFERNDEPAGVAHALMLLGNIALARGAYTDASELLQRSLEVAQRSDNKLEMGRAYRSLGLVASTIGETDEARRLFETSLALLTEVNNALGMAGALSNLAGIAHTERNYAEARRLFAAALEQFRAIDFAWGIAFTLTSLGETVEALGEYAEARTLHERALDICRDIGHRWGMALCLAHVASACLKSGAFSDGHVAVLQSLKIAVEIGTTPLTLLVLSLYGGLLLRTASVAKSVEFLTLVAAHPQVERDTALNVAALLEEARALLPLAEYEAASRVGVTLPLDAAVAQVLATRS